MHCKGRAAIKVVNWGEQINVNRCSFNESQRCKKLGLQGQKQNLIKTANFLIKNMISPRNPTRSRITQPGGWLFNDTVSDSVTIW
jgi:hypothetical protein